MVRPRSPVRSWMAAHGKYCNLNLQYFIYMDIQVLVDRFCDYSIYIRGFSPTTILRYRRAVKLYSKHAGIKEIEQVNDDNVRNYLYYGRTERNWAANSFITYHKSLVVFFRWCRENKFMQIDPIKDIELPKLHKRLPPKLTKQD